MTGNGPKSSRWYAEDGASIGSGSSCFSKDVAAAYCDVRVVRGHHVRVVERTRRLLDGLNHDIQRFCDRLQRIDELSAEYAGHRNACRGLRDRADDAGRTASSAAEDAPQPVRECHGVLDVTGRNKRTTSRDPPRRYRRPGVHDVPWTSTVKRYLCFCFPGRSHAFTGTR